MFLYVGQIINKQSSGYSSEGKTMYSSHDLQGIFFLVNIAFQILHSNLNLLQTGGIGRQSSDFQEFGMY